MQVLDRQRAVSDVRAETIARRLGALARLSPAEIALLNRVGGSPASIWPPRALMEMPLDEGPAPRYLVSGWAARMRELHDGRRQLIHLILPGDALTSSLHIRQHQQAIRALTTVQIVDGSQLKEAAKDFIRFPSIGAAVELAAAADRALLMEQVTRLGRHTAYERLANLFLELHYRCETIGQVFADSFHFPLTQAELGDLLGLSVVHVNRTLQLMRREGLIELKQGRLSLLNMGALGKTADFHIPNLAYIG